MKKVFMVCGFFLVDFLCVTPTYGSFNTSNALNNFGFNDMHNQGNYGFANDENDIYDQNNRKLIAHYFMHKQEDDLDVSIPIEHKEKNSLLQAVIDGDFEKVQKLLQGKVNPNKGNKDNITALHFAAAGNYVDITKLLLEYKADPNAQNNEGDTPLHIAAKESAFFVAQALIQHGAHLLQNNDDKSPLDYATNNRMRKILSSHV